MQTHYLNEVENSYKYFVANIFRTICSKFCHNRSGFVDCISKSIMVCFFPVHSVVLLTNLLVSKRGTAKGYNFFLRHYCRYSILHFQFHYIGLNYYIRRPLQSSLPTLKQKLTTCELLQPPHRLLASIVMLSKWSRLHYCNAVLVVCP